MSPQPASESAVELDHEALREVLEPLALGLASPATSRTAWRLYAALFIYQDLAPLTAKDFQELVGASAASTSTALRELEQGGLITRTRIAGCRADVYDLVDEIQYGENHARSMARPQPALRAALAVLPEGSKAWLRIQSMLDLEDFMAERVSQLLDEWYRERRSHFGR